MEQKTSKWLSEIEPFFNTLEIKMIDEIKYILQFEQNRFENPSKISNKVSFFPLIKNLSSEVKDYTTTIMQSLSHSNESAYRKKIILFQRK